MVESDVSDGFKVFVDVEHHCLHHIGDPVAFIILDHHDSW